MDKEKTAETCCFVCKDGGDLLICDHKDCQKCFHPFCVGQDDSILESDSDWVCDRHTCFRCRRSSTYLYCYTCKNSVCRNCLPAVDFFQIKGKYGFCEFCLGVVLLIEENKDYDSDGDKVDFTDKQTVEFYFVGYYHIIKEKEGFELKDLYAAVERAKIRKERQSESDLEEVEEEEDEEEEYSLSDYDGTEDESRLHSENGTERMKSAIKSNKKETKLEGEESEEIRSQETKNGQRASKMNAIELLDEEEEFKISDYDGTDDESRLHRENRSKKRKSAVKSNKKENKLEREELEETRSQETKNGQRASKTNVIELLDEEGEYNISDFDGIADESGWHRENRPKRMKTAIKSNKKENQLEGEESEELRSQGTKNGQPASETNLIELVDSDGENGKFDNIKSDRWCIRGPYGDQRDKCSLAILRKWSQQSSYASKFKVWRDDENEENAIWLLEAISIAFPQKSKDDI